MYSHRNGESDVPTAPGWYWHECRWPEVVEVTLPDIRPILRRESHAN